jgi:hypothetical protein
VVRDIVGIVASAFIAARSAMRGHVWGRAFVNLSLFNHYQ